MSKKYFLEIGIQQFKRKLFLKPILLLFVFLQMVFPNQVFASSFNNTIINQTTSNGVSSKSFVVKEKTDVPVTGVTLNKSSVTLKIKASVTLTASVIPSNATDKKVYWGSSSTSVAKVDLDSGRVTGVKQGTALITASTEDGNMTAVCEVEVYNPDIITFEDINLENVVRDSIEKPTGDLLKSDVKDITSLDARNKSITNLSGIENLVNLKRLDISSNQIDDISDLQNLTRLNYLSLNDNQSVDLDILKNIKGLTGLNLGGDQISDITPLESLTKLKSLSLSNNQIVNILSLKKLTRLTNLYLQQNQISNINPLRGLKTLKYLDLSQNQISDSDRKTLRNALTKCKITY